MLSAKTWIQGDGLVLRIAMLLIGCDTSWKRQGRRVVSFMWFWFHVDVVVVELSLLSMLKGNDWLIQDVVSTDVRFVCVACTLLYVEGGQLRNIFTSPRGWWDWTMGFVCFYRNEGVSIQLKRLRRNYKLTCGWIKAVPKFFTMLRVRTLHVSTLYTTVHRAKGRMWCSSVGDRITPKRLTSQILWRSNPGDSK